MSDAGIEGVIERQSASYPTSAQITGSSKVKLMTAAQFILGPTDESEAILARGIL